jgi:hypothetical protein
MMWHRHEVIELWVSFGGVEIHRSMFYKKGGWECCTQYSSCTVIRNDLTVGLGHGLAIGARSEVPVNSRWVLSSGGGNSRGGARSGGNSSGKKIAARLHLVGRPITYRVRKPWDNLCVRVLSCRTVRACLVATLLS